MPAVPRHRVEKKFICCVQFEQRQDIWVLEDREDLEFAKEPLGTDVR
jgi:hypothetical protein